jgi:hypothetical protein
MLKRNKPEKVTGYLNYCLRVKKMIVLAFISYPTKYWIKKPAKAFVLDTPPR